jgi:hypothetical protein
VYLLQVNWYGQNREVSPCATYLFLAAVAEVAVVLWEPLAQQAEVVVALVEVK